MPVNFSERRATGAALAASAARPLRALLLASAMLAAPLAQAAHYTLPGNLPPGCSASGASYSCGSLSFTWGDVITLASPKPATLTVNGSLDTSNLSLNASGSAGDLSLVVTGNLTAGNQAVLNANIQAGAVIDGGGNGGVRFGGTLRTVGSGAIALSAASSVAGNVSSVSGAITLGQSATVGGTVSSSSGGTISLDYLAQVAGAVSTSGSVRLGQEAVVNGAVSGDALSLAYKARILGAASASGGADIGQEAVISGDLTATSGDVSLAYAAQVAGNLTVAGRAKVSLGQSSVVGGAVTAATGDVELSYFARVAGNVSTSTGRIELLQDAVASACVQSSSSSRIRLNYNAAAAQVCCGSVGSCSNSCVDNISNLAMPALCITPARLIARFDFEEAAWKGIAGELKDSAGYTGGPFNGQAQGSALPSPASTGPARSGNPGSCGYASLPGPINNGGGFLVGKLPVSTTTGAKTSVAFWMYWDGSNGVMPIGWQAQDLWLQSGGFGFNTNSSDVYGIANASLSKTWKHVVAVFTNGSVTSNKLYIDGVSQSLSHRTTSRSPNATNAVVGSSLRVGGFGASNSYRMAGRIDQLRVYNGELSDSEVASLYKETQDCGGLAGPDHYEITLPANSLACVTSTVTVTACATSASPCTSAYTAASGSTATLSTSGATLGAGTVTFNAAGVASTTLSYPAAANGAVATVTLSGESMAATNARQCCPDGVNCTAAASCSSSFATAGFIVTSAANGTTTATLPSQTAGTASATHYLRAVKTNTTTKACEAALTGATAVNWAHQCNNPATCATASPVSVTGSAATAVSGNPNSGVASSTAVAMVFDANGNAPFSFNHADVGQTRFWVSKTVNGAALSGSSNAFVTKPASLAIANIRQTAGPALANPAAASAAGAKFVKAGEAFSATVSALTSGGVATPNFGRETAPEAVLLSAALVLPAGGVAGMLANASIGGAAFSSGAASVANLAYSEVGIVGLTPTLADGDYLGAGAVAGTTSANVGRFVPDHFTITAGSPVPGCSAAFTYLGQDGLSTPFTLTAQNAANATTQNYSGSFAKLALGSWSGFGFSASGQPAGSSLAASATAPSGSWLSGVALVSARHQFSRPASPSAEASVTVSALPVDSDGTSAGTATAVGAATALRHGRLRLANAYGSAAAALQVPVTSEYWRGNAWVLNSADSCTTLAAANVALSNPRGAGGGPSGASTSAGSAALTGGSGLLTLAAPSPAGSSLSVDIAINLGSTGADQSCLPSHPASSGGAREHLRSQNGACATTADRDPAARASFGIFSPETRKTVHVRELF